MEKQDEDEESNYYQTQVDVNDLVYCLFEHPSAENQHNYTKLQTKCVLIWISDINQGKIKRDYIDAFFKGQL